MMLSGILQHGYVMKYSSLQLLAIKYNIKHLFSLSYPLQISNYPFSLLLHIPTLYQALRL